MLVLATGLTPVDALPAVIALRELLDSRHPVAIIDGLGLESALPTLDREALLIVIEHIIDRHEAGGPHSYVVTVPTCWLDDLKRLCFFLKRRHGQKTVHAPFDRVAGPDRIGAMLSEPASLLEPWSPKPPHIETDRLALTWPTPDQVEGYYKAIAGTDIFDTLCWDGPSSSDELHDRQLYNRRQFVRGAGHDASFGVIERDSDRLVGVVSLRPHTPDDFRADIGFAFEPGVHGRGYGTEAVGALVDYAFAQRDCQRVEAEVFLGNDASRRLLEKLGFEVEGVKRSNHRKRGDITDEWLMAITRDRWS